MMMTIAMMMITYKTNERHTCVTLNRFMAYDGDDNGDDADMKRTSITSV